MMCLVEIRPEEEVPLEAVGRFYDFLREKALEQIWGDPDPVPCWADVPIRVQRALTTAVLTAFVTTLGPFSMSLSFRDDVPAKWVPPTGESDA